MFRSNNRSDETLCWLCDFWWLILLIISLVVVALLTRNLWLPAIIGERPLPTAISAQPFVQPITVVPPTGDVNTPVPSTVEILTPLAPTPTTITPVAIEPTQEAGGGNRAPAFTLDRLDGGQISLADYANKPVLLVFFASWCPHCTNEAPILKAIADQYSPQGLNIIAVNITYNDNQQDVIEFVNRNEWDFPVALDVDRGVSDSYGVSGIPTNIVIDRQGNILASVSGEMTEAQMTDLVNKILP